MKKLGLMTILLLSLCWGMKAQARSAFCYRHPHTPHCAALRHIPPPPPCYRHPHIRPCRKHFNEYNGEYYYHHHRYYRHHRHHHHQRYHHHRRYD